VHAPRTTTGADATGTIFEITASRCACKTRLRADTSPPALSDAAASPARLIARRRAAPNPLFICSPNTKGANRNSGRAYKIFSLYQEYQIGWGKPAMIPTFIFPSESAP
jgi:hypothetical protein